MRKILCVLFILLLGTTAFAQEATETPSPEAWLSLNSAGQEAAVVLAELESDGLIPSGASLAFEQAQLSYSGEGVQFSNFAIGTNAKNLLYSMTLDFSASGENLEFCGIAARTVREESNREEGQRTITSVSLNAYVLVGIDNRGNLFVVDNQGEESSATTAALPEDIGSPIQLTVLIINNKLYAYANNSLLIDGLEIAEGSGAFAFVFNSGAEATSCLGTNVYAYTFPDEISTTCTISPLDVANKRQAATTDAQVMGQMQAGDTSEAIGQLVDSDGYTWWQLSDESWVRDDVVTTTGFCLALPNVVN